MFQLVPHSSGSIVADTILEFDNTNNTNNTSPNVTDVKNTFDDAIKNGNFSFPADPASVNVTDIPIGQYLFRYIFSLLDRCLLHFQPKRNDIDINI